MKKLSIIIPVYNAEPYISELIECLHPQLTEEVEVICIDDGSRIPFTPKHDKIKFIRQQNKGVSGAFVEITAERIVIIKCDRIRVRIVVGNVC